MGWLDSLFLDHTKVMDASVWLASQCSHNIHRPEREENKINKNFFSLLLFIPQIYWGPRPFLLSSIKFDVERDSCKRSAQFFIIHSWVWGWLVCCCLYSRPVQISFSTFILLLLYICVVYYHFQYDSNVLFQPSA